MADPAKYQMALGLAEKQCESGDFRGALVTYRQALKHADPSEYQMLLDKIREARERAAAAPKPSPLEKAKEELRFTKYPVKFSDVIGYARQKKLAKRIIELPTKQPGLFTHFKVAKSTGIILYGPPGTGKTLFAKAISGEFGIPMKDIFISDILDKLVGGSEKNMRDAFKDAKSVQPSILFFDELDALGSSRESANEFTNNDIKNTINEFLKQTSELHDNKEHQVFVIGATNLPWLIDSAIKRSGRLEHTIYMGPPGLLERRKLFAYYLPAKKEGTRVSLLHLAMATIRYSQADIEKVCAGAKRRAIEQGRSYIRTRDILNVLKDKSEGVSSLDEWVLTAQKTYLKSEKTTIQHSGFLGLKRDKVRTEETGKLSAGELKLYKPLINSLKSQKRWWHISNFIRYCARNTGI